ncbi:MAG: ribokinase [Clostridia bacterium]|nr:ribokinase [Clostridia bacterium]
MKKIIIVGSLNTDLVINAPYMPKGGETLKGDGFMINSGGKGANQACAVSKLGGNAYMCGCVGNDSFGSELISQLSSYGVNTDFVRKVDNTPSGVAVIVVTEGENRIIIDSGANGHLSKNDIDSVLEIADEGDIYLTQLENPIDIIGYGLERARAMGLFVVLNPAPASREIFKYLKYVDLITPNESELALLGGKEKLFDAGIQTIITTLGSRGFEIATRDGSEIYPCIKVKALDTTAAGDTACGGLCVKLACGEDVVSAMKFGSLAASIACTRYGAQRSIPTVNEIKEFKYEG